MKVFKVLQKNQFQWETLTLAAAATSEEAARLTDESDGKVVLVEEVSGLSYKTNTPIVVMKNALGHAK
jgi:hypothetical protein